MPPTRIIIHHPLVNGQIQFSSCRECVTVVVFMFKGGPERFRTRIVPAHTSTSHGLAKPGFPAFICDVTAGVLTSSICMEDGAVDAAVSPSSDGHVQTGDDQFG